MHLAAPKNFVQRLCALKCQTADTKLLERTNVQYAHQSQNIGTNTRFRWTIKQATTVHCLEPGCTADPKSHDVSIVPDSDIVQ